MESNLQLNKSIVREYVEKVFNEHNPTLAEKYCTPDVKWHGGTLGTMDGIKNLTELLVGFIAAFPDLHATEYDIVAEGNKVAVRFVVEATHRQLNGNSANRKQSSLGRGRCVSFEGRKNCGRMGSG
jgi:predicted SnoaL-like aldol condensation-catalyzing enzyme